MVLNITSRDETEVTAAPGTVTFTPEDWDSPRTVTITGVNDTLNDGDVRTTVLFATSSGDGVYDSLPDQAVSALTLDDDVAVPGFTITESEGSTVVSESGGTDTFSVVLNMRPSSNVALNLASSDLTEATVSHQTLLFTSSNWSTPRLVTVRGVADGRIADGDATLDIVVSVDAGSSDVAYASVADQAVRVINRSHTSFTAHVLQATGRPADFIDVVSTTGNQSLDLELRAADGRLLSPGIGGRVSLAGYSAGTYHVWVNDDRQNYKVTPSVGFGQATSNPSTPGLDFDASGDFRFSDDGIMLLAYSLGSRGTALEAFSSSAQRSGLEIQTVIEQLADSLDLDGDGRFQFSTDGILLLADSLGIQGAGLEPFRAPGALRDGGEITSRLGGLLGNSHQRVQTSDAEASGTAEFTDASITEDVVLSFPADAPTGLGDRPASSSLAISVLAFQDFATHKANASPLHAANAAPSEPHALSFEPVSGSADQQPHTHPSGLDGLFTSSEELSALLL